MIFSSFGHIQLDNGLKRLAEGLGADFFGVADLSSANDFILDQGGQAIAEYPRAVSIGIALSSPSVDQLPHRAERP